MTVLIQLTQKLLEQNDVESLVDPHTIEDYLVVQSHTKAPQCGQLLIESSNEGLNVGICFSSELQQLLSRPITDIQRKDLAVMTEELSHFIYLSYHASLDQPISQLELEVQAEIDRFVFFENFYNPLKTTRKSMETLEFLFGQPQLHSFVQNDPILEARYLEAYRLGRKACLYLVSKLREDPAYALPFCRKIFRQSGHTKLHTIDRLKAA